VIRRLALCCSPQLLIAFDFSAMTISVAPLAAELSMPRQQIPLVFAAYSLPFGSLLLCCGWLVDRVGARRCLTAGLALFACGAAGSSVAPGVAVLLASRAVEGAGAAAMAPAALALTTASFPAAADRRRALSWYATSISLGFVLGALAAGAAGQAAGWRLAVASTGAAAAAALGGALAMRDPRGAASGGAGAGAAAAGAATAAAIAGSLALCALSAGLASPGAVAACGAAAIVLAASGRALGRRARAPLVPRGLAIDTTFRLVVAGGALVTATGVTGTLLLSLYLQDLRAYAPMEVAGVFGAFGLTAFGGRRLAAALAARSGDLRVLGTGLAMQGAALASLALAIGLVPSLPALLALTAAFGLGHVVANAGVALGIATAPAPWHGVAAAVVATAQYAGAALGPLAVVGLVASAGPPGAAAGIATAGGVSLLGGVAVAALGRT